MSENILTRKYQCECCGFTTLTTHLNEETCPLCWWEDTGQSDKNAEVIEGGPNGDYSLSEARSNFSKYLQMYRLQDNRFLDFKNQKIDAIKKEIIKVLIKIDEEDKPNLKLVFKLISLYDLLEIEKKKCREKR